MRLAIIRQRYTPYGGAERFVEGALEALLERGIAISLYTRQWPQTRLQLIEPVICNPFYIGRLWRDWSFARAVCREVTRKAPDLVQSHERLLCCDVYRAGDGVHRVWLDERLRDASAFERWRIESNLYHRYVLEMERRLFASPWLRAVICNSKMVRNEIRERFGVPEDKLPVIYNAVDSDVFSPALRQHRAAMREKLGVADDATVFLLVGSGYARKGVATAIAALSRLPGDTYLFVVGRDKSRWHYKRVAQQLGVAHRVVLVGAQDDPRPFFGAADAFVLPTRYDPCPNAALEAMACGLPVVTSTKCGAAELVSEHDAGFVCDARDVDALARHMMTLTARDAREALGARAREVVLPLTPAAMTLQMVLLYRDLLAAAYAAKTPKASKPADLLRYNRGHFFDAPAAALAGSIGVLQSDPLPAPVALRSTVLVGVRAGHRGHGHRRCRRRAHGVHGDADHPEAAESRSGDDTAAASRRGRGVPAAWDGLVHVRIRHGVDRSPRRFRSAKGNDRSAAVASHAVLRRAVVGAPHLEVHLRCLPARCRELVGHHHRGAQRADHHRKRRATAVAELAADAGRHRPAADGRRGDALFQPKASPHGARRAAAHGIDHPRARGDHRQRARGENLRWTSVREGPRGRRREQAATVDEQAIVRERGELAAVAVRRRVRGRLCRLHRAQA